MVQPYNSMPVHKDEAEPAMIELSYDDMVDIAMQAAASSDQRDQFTAQLRVDTLRELGNDNNPLETLDNEYGFAQDVTFEMLITDAFRYVRCELDRQTSLELQDKPPAKMGGAPLKLVVSNPSLETDANTIGPATLPDHRHSPSLGVVPDDKAIEVALIAIEPELRASEKSDQSILDGMLKALDNDDNVAASRGLGVLYERYYDVVYKFAMFRTGDVQLSEDFAQETFVRALSAIQRGKITHFVTSEGIPSAGAWLVTISRNLIYDHFKSTREKKVRTAIELNTSNVDVLLPDNPSAEDCATSSVQAEDVREAISRIRSADQRRTIELRFLQDYSPAETAKICGIKIGAVKASQHRAIKTLTRLLHDYDPIALNEI